MNRITAGKFWIIIVLVLLAGSLVGYQVQLWVGTSSEQSDQSSVLDYPLQLKDQGNYQVTIPKEPQRIVSLIPSHTEIAYALGLGEKMVGVTSNDNYPAAVKKLPKVGDMQINAGAVVKLKPDLVLASKRNGEEVIQQLKQLDLNVLVLDAENIRSIYQSIDILSQATDQTQQADQLIKKMEKQVRTVAKKVAQIPDEKRKQVWLELGPELYTSGSGTLAHEVIQLAGGKNLAAQQTGYPQLSPETVVAKNPDVIISTYGQIEKIKQRPAWSVVKAIKKKQVYHFNSDLINRPGPRVTEAIQKLASILYPELM